MTRAVSFLLALLLTCSLGLSPVVIQDGPTTCTTSGNANLFSSDETVILNSVLQIERTESSLAQYWSIIVTQSAYYLFQLEAPPRYSPGAGAFNLPVTKGWAPITVAAIADLGAASQSVMAVTEGSYLTFGSFISVVPSSPPSLSPIGPAGTFEAPGITAMAFGRVVAVSVDNPNFFAASKDTLWHCTFTSSGAPSCTSRAIGVSSLSTDPTWVFSRLTFSSLNVFVVRGRDVFFEQLDPNPPFRNQSQSLSFFPNPISNMQLWYVASNHGRFETSFWTSVASSAAGRRGCVQFEQRVQQACVPFKDDEQWLDSVPFNLKDANYPIHLASQSGSSVNLYLLYQPSMGSNQSTLVSYGSHFVGFPVTQGYSFEVDQDLSTAFRRWSFAWVDPSQKEVNYLGISDDCHSRLGRVALQPKRQLRDACRSNPCITGSPCQNSCCVFTEACGTACTTSCNEVGGLGCDTSKTPPSC